MEYEGRLHSALDNDKNLGRAVIQMAADNVHLRFNSQIDLKKSDWKIPFCCGMFALSKSDREKLRARSITPMDGSGDGPAQNTPAKRGRPLELGDPDLDRITAEFEAMMLPKR